MRPAFKKNVTDAALLAFMYSLGMYVVEGALPTGINVLTFMGLFVVATTMLHLVDAEYAEALPRGAAIVIAAKYINLLGGA